MTERNIQYAFAVMVCGLPGALKTEFARRIARRLEAPMLTLSAFIPVVKEQGRQLHPVDVADRLNAEHGGGYLVRQAVRTVPHAKILVIDGARHPGQLKELRRITRRVVLVDIERAIALRHAMVRNNTRGLPPVDPFVLDQRNLDAGLGELRREADLVVQAGQDSDEDIARVEGVIWRCVCSHFGDAIVNWVSGLGFGGALQFMTARRLDAYLVGGIVRDFLFLSSTPSDLDIVIGAKAEEAYGALDSRYRHRMTRYQSRRYEVPGELEMDVWSPAQFESGFASVEAMLGHFDLSVNAIAVRLSDGELVNPVGGLRDSNDHTVTILESRWQAASELEVALLCIRTLGLVARHNLRLCNPQVLCEHLPKLSVLSDEALLRRAGPPDRIRAGLAELAETGRLLPDQAQLITRHTRSRQILPGAE